MLLLLRSAGILYSSDNSCTGVSLASHHLSSLKVTLGNKFPESLIRIDYTRYYYYHRIRGVLRFYRCIDVLIISRGRISKRRRLF